jgi:hypothetical protein
VTATGALSRVAELARARLSKCHKYTLYFSKCDCIDMGARARGAAQRPRSHGLDRHPRGREHRLDRSNRFTTFARESRAVIASLRTPPSSPALRDEGDAASWRAVDRRDPPSLVIAPSLSSKSRTICRAVPRARAGCESGPPHRPQLVAGLTRVTSIFCICICICICISARRVLPLTQQHARERGGRAPVPATRARTLEARRQAGLRGTG